MPSHIRKLSIQRFRGIESLTWNPMKGINVIFGGGDVGKTTILEAIGLLFHPTNSYTLADADYWRREVESEFAIEAVMSLPELSAVNQQLKMNFPWEWDGESAVLPSVDAPDDKEEPGNPVYRLRVRGTDDLELAYEIVQPDETVNLFSVGLRRAIGLVRLLGDDRNDRDLRLVYGSGLDRLLGDRALRSRLGQQLAGEDLKENLNEEAQKSLVKLEEVFADRALPTTLGLRFTGGPGISLNALLGLTAETGDVSLPLSSWGAGTRRLAALAIADSIQGGRPIAVVDEIERGLEPYRQRKLIESLKASGSQVFITTHSAASVAAASDAGLWYLDSKGQLGRLPNAKIAQHQKADPDMFLARLTVVCEGATEVGFASFLLEKAIGNLLDHGVWITDGGGHEKTLGLLEALTAGHLSFAAMVDNEGKWPTRWSSVEESLGDLLIQWDEGCLEQNVIPLFEDESLFSLIEDPVGEWTGTRLRSLAVRLGTEEKEFEHIKKTAGDNLIQVITEAAAGKVPDEFADGEKSKKKEFRGHASAWFKSKRGGRELAEKVFNLGVWPKLKPKVLPFLNAVRSEIGRESIEELPQ